jgi:SanA protein
MPATFILRGLRLIAFAALPLILLVLPSHLMRLRFEPLIFSPPQAPHSPTAIVFGAGLRRDGSPSPVLSDRVRAAVELYLQGKVGRLLMSGSTRPGGYDEPLAMRQLAVQLGVPQEDILMDPGGTRTLETCRQARQAFGIRQALLVSQSFHLPRALATCSALGVHAAGVSADLREYSPRTLRYWSLREIPASLIAALETGWGALIAGPRPAFPEAADLSGDKCGSPTSS